LSRFLKVVTEEAVGMSDGKLFHAVGPATQNAPLPRRRLVRGTTRSPRAAELALFNVGRSNNCSICCMLVEPMFAVKFSRV